MFKYTITTVLTMSNTKCYTSDDFFNIICFRKLDDENIEEIKEKFEKLIGKKYLIQNKEEISELIYEDDLGEYILSGTNVYLDDEHDLEIYAYCRYAKKYTTFLCYEDENYEFKFKFLRGV